ncbi:hypothetical protein LY76DRAFT_157004 [Colletotrichum caudatum]|nr:hypothetical protein LY76DRAFT_157004 [Colletotrichum caudatum]
MKKVFGTVPLCGRGQTASFPTPGLLCCLISCFVCLFLFFVLLSFQSPKKKRECRYCRGKVLRGRGGRGGDIMVKSQRGN